MGASPSLAFLARGELFVLDEGAREPRRVESRFVDEYRARVRSLQRKHAWKEQGAGARFMRGATPMLWGDGAELEAVPVAFTGVARARSGKLLYAISTGVVGGVFELDLESGVERRVFHSADRRIEQLATSRDHDVVACTLRGKGGTSAIAVMAADGSELFAVTDGDVIDLSPQWLPAAAVEGDRRHVLVYQSAGVGRDAEGNFVAVGPASVGMLDAESGELQTLAADPRRDFLMPHMGEDRTLYCVRHAYADASDPSPARVLLDVVLFPFRLLAAVLGFLSFFTMRYTGRPLFTSGDARRRGADIRQMMMTGNLASARSEANAAAERAALEAVRGWELVAIREGGGEAVLARRVRAFDRAVDGTLFVTDGARIERIATDGAVTKLAEAAGVTEIVALA